MGITRGPSPLILSRTDLYELAWSKPLTELANDFVGPASGQARRVRGRGVE